MSSGDVVARTVMMLLPQKPALVHTSLHWLPNACTVSHRPALAHRHLHWFTQAFIGSHTPALAFRCLHMVQKACFGSLAFTGITKRLHWFTRACSASNRPALGLQNACIHSQMSLVHRVTHLLFFLGSLKKSCIHLEIRQGSMNQFIVPKLNILQSVV